MPASKQPKIEKTCRYCKKTFLSNNKKQISCSSTCNTFYYRDLDPDKHRAYAAKLMRQRSPEKKAKDEIRKRELRLKREYGISQDIFVEMKKSQNGKCAICNKVSVLVIDHDHITGKVRNLLCHQCNRGLGFFEDNIDLLLFAHEYLKKWKT